MSLSQTFDSAYGTDLNEINSAFMQTLSTMTPKQYTDHILNIHNKAKKEGAEEERDEIICRLLASGMNTDEIATILGIKRNYVEDIEKFNAQNKILEYAKKLQARRRRESAEK